MKTKTKQLDEILKNKNLTEEQKSEIEKKKAFLLKDKTVRK